MDKEFILEEIRRTADSNNLALGGKSFENETGIKRYWPEQYWGSYSNAVEAAGCIPQEATQKITDEELIESLISLGRELGEERLPTDRQIRFKRSHDSSFPSLSTFRRLGNKNELANRIADYCRNQQGYEDVLKWCKDYLESSPAQQQIEEGRHSEARSPGIVYLQKMDRWYYIGRTTNKERRYENHERTLPVPPKVIAELSTSDSVGMEAYWHTRFSEKAVDKKGKTWFTLTAADVRAFKAFYVKSAK